MLNLFVETQEGGAPDDRKLLGHGEVTSIGIARMQRQFPGSRLQLCLNPAAKCGPPVVSHRPYICNQCTCSEQLGYCSEGKKAEAYGSSADNRECTELKQGSL